MSDQAVDVVVVVFFSFCGCCCVVATIVGVAAREEPRTRVTEIIRNNASILFIVGNQMKLIATEE